MEYDWMEYDWMEWMGANGTSEDGQSPFDALLFDAQEGDESVLAAVNHMPTLVTMTNGGGCTLLHMASMGHQLELIEALLDRKSDIHARDHDGDDALKAAFVNERSDAIDTVKLLISRGADPCTVGWKGVTAVMSAIQNRDITSALYLLSKGADLNAEANGDSFAEMRPQARLGFPALAPPKRSTAMDYVFMNWLLSSSEKAAYSDSLRKAFAEGPHPSQVHRRAMITEERVARRMPFLRIVVCHDFLPLAARRAELAHLFPPLPTDAELPDLPNETPEQRYRLLRDKILTHPGLVKHIVSFL